MQTVRHDTSVISLFLCGDVMTGRGIDQVLPYPVNPILYEPYLHDAREYVELAEAAHGALSRPVAFDYIWGDALEELERAGVDSRIVNLETAITTAGEACPKEINYRMHPANIGCITAARIDCCCLANNHVLDWGYAGLEETIATLDKAGVAHANAERTAAEARAPGVLDLGGRGRVLVFALGSPASGVPFGWAAASDRPGVHIVERLSDETAHRLADEVRKYKQPGDIALVSIHWGGNWGYEIPWAQTIFAHRLIDEGVDLIHGHSSHHAKAIEVYKDHLILYGCGDFVTDYEGIEGYEEFRGDLSVMYLPALEATSGRLLELRMTVLQPRRFRLNRASTADVQWLSNLLNRIGAGFGTRFDVVEGHTLRLKNEN